MAEEGRLTQSSFREHFVLRLFAHFEVSRLPAKVSAIQKLHEAYKFVILAHDASALRQLGRLAANSQKLNPSDVKHRYRKIFLKALATPSSVKKRTNAIQHIYGFVKDKVNSKEKKKILKSIDQYRKGELPYVAMVTLLHHVIEINEVQYIEKQKFFSPYPEDLKLNHFL